MNRITFLVSFLLFFMSCGDLVKFEEPQPLNKKDLKGISKKIQGIYLSVSDSSFLTINSHSIVEQIELDIRTLFDSLDIEIDSSKISEQSDNFIEVDEPNFNLKIELKGDSVLGHYSYRDTIFEISDNQKIRKFKGHYFLNFRQGEQNWRVRRLTLEKGILTFSKIQKPEDIEELRQITEIKEIKSDSGKVTGYRLNPTRKELKQLLNKSFVETGTFKKIK